jgi:Mrp family chromosome partitioning ATPase
MFVVERFAFPKLSEPSRDVPVPEGLLVAWPDREVTETVSACAAAAQRILHQSSLARLRVVLFTSPDDGDGKTGVVIALAPELAQRSTGNVLVVDANFRKPDLTARLNVPADNTISQPALIYPTNLLRLSVLPVPAVQRARWDGSCTASTCWNGSCTATPGATVQRAPLPTTPRFPCLNSEELREGWSLVLVDAASLVHPEVAPMISDCDGVYLVVRLGHTARRAVADAARAIQAAGGRLLGSVVVG